MIFRTQRTYLVGPVQPVSKFNLPEFRSIAAMAHIAEQEGLDWLAANQVGINQRIIVGKVDETQWKAYYNPSIEIPNKEDVFYHYSICPHSQFKIVVKRYGRVILYWDDPEFIRQSREFVGVQAAEVQTAINYLDGKDLSYHEKLGDWGHKDELYK